MTIMRPPGMPERLDRCWGKLFQDGDRECEQCRWNDTCRSRVLEVAATAPARPPTSLPVFTAPVPQRPVAPTAPTGIVPMPTRPAAAPPAFSPPATQATAQVRYATPSAPVPTAPPVPAQQQYAQPYQYQQTQGYSIPDPNNPNPLIPMFRPGAQGPAYYFNQYPGESTGGRLVKNSLLRAFEAVFSEVAHFFRHWTWPPSQQ